MIKNENDSISFLNAVKKIENFHKVRFAFDHQKLAHLKVKQTDFEAPLDQVLLNIIDSKKYNFEISEHTILVIPIKLEVKRNVSLSGIIVDEDTGEALPNAVVHLKNLGKYTVTNRDGQFNFLNIPADTSLLEISYLGYLSQKFKPNQFENLKDVKINLSNRAELLEEITVSDKRQKGFDISLEPSKLSVRMDDLKTLSSFGEPDVFRALQLLPGISGTNETSSGLSIRGGSPEQNLVLFDGFTIYHLDHFFGMFSAINSNVVKDIQIYKGGFGAEYGTRISGVMDITGKTGNNQKPSGNLSLNFISANGMLEVPVGKKLSILVAARRSYTDVIQSSLYNKLFNHVRSNNPNELSQSGEDGVEEIEPEFYFYDVNTKLTYKPNDENLFSISLYKGKDNLFLNDSGGEDDGFFAFNYDIKESNIWGNKGATARYAHQWNDKLSSDITFSSSEFFRDQTYDYTSEIEFDSVFFEIEDDSVFLDTLSLIDDFDYSYNTKNVISETSVKATSEYKINDSNILNAGLYSIYNRVIDNTIFDNIEQNNNDTNSTLNGLYIQYSYLPNAKTKLTTGLRYSNYSLMKKWYFEPRISLNHKLTEEVNLKGSMGRYYQFVSNIQVRDPTASRSSYWSLVGEGDTPLLASNHYNAGITYQKEGLTIDFEGYYKTATGVSQLFTNQDSDSNFQEDFFTGDARFFGIDFLIKKHFNRIDSWISYTLSKGEQRFQGINFGKYHPTNNDQRHEFKWVNILHIKKWIFSTTWIYGRGKPYTLDNLSQGEDGLLFFTDLNYNARNSSRLPDYHRLDMNIGYHSSFADKIKIDIGLNLLNIYNRTNLRGYRITPFLNEFGDSESTLKSIKLLGLTPSIFLNLSF